MSIYVFYESYLDLFSHSAIVFLDVCLYHVFEKDTLYVVPKSQNL